MEAELRYCYNLLLLTLLTLNTDTDTDTDTDTVTKIYLLGYNILNWVFHSSIDYYLSNQGFGIESLPLFNLTDKTPIFNWV